MWPPTDATSDARPHVNPGSDGGPRPRTPVSTFLMSLLIPRYRSATSTVLLANEPAAESQPRAVYSYNRLWRSRDASHAPGRRPLHNRTSFHTVLGVRQASVSLAFGPTPKLPMHGVCSTGNH